MDEPQKVRDLISLLKLGGQWTDFPESRWPALLKTLQIIRTVFIVAVFVLAFVGLFLNPGNNLSLTGIFVFPGLVVSAHNVILLVKENDCSMFLRGIGRSNGVNETFEERWVFDRTVELGWRLTDAYKKALMSLVLLYSMGPPLAVLTGLHELDVPMPLDSYFDHFNNGKLYWFAKLVSALWLICIGVSNAACEGLLFMGIMYIAAYLKTASLSISLLCPKKGPWRIESLIRQHLHILRLYVDLKGLLGVIIALQNVISTISICLTAYTLTQVLRNNDITLLIFYVVFLIILALTMYSLCFIGEYLKIQGESFYGSLIQCAWYTQKPRTRGNLILPFMQSQRPMVIDFKGLSPMEMKTFMQIINASYSYFMLLRSTK